MCGIVAYNSSVTLSDAKKLFKLSMSRGRDSSGLFYLKRDGLESRLFKSPEPIDKLLKKVDISDAEFVMGHTRLVTNSTGTNQPVYNDEFVAVHNGIITNYNELWNQLGIPKINDLDSEIIPNFLSHYTQQGLSEREALNNLLRDAKGTINSIIYSRTTGNIYAISNNGSLFVGEKNDAWALASEKSFLTKINFVGIDQIFGIKNLRATRVSSNFLAKDFEKKRDDLVPPVIWDKELSGLLLYPEHNLKRCTKCILPETMPYIKFNDKGVCNYCENYRSNKPKNKASDLHGLVESYRRKKCNDVIVPFSGGRDSFYTMHIVKEELGMSPIAYTYDWGMVTDLARRNVSNLTAQMGVEHIVVAADMELKRRNVKTNLQAWLKSPNIGMLSMLTAGDKHFFKYVEKVKRDTGISLNLWGVNPMEVTHFKTGFMGMAPNFAETKVYNSKWSKQFKYQQLRFKEMIKSPGYFNSSIFDTLEGEYWRTFYRKSDYFHVFDYYQWNESNIENILSKYDFERAIDTSTSWRIGDGTAAFYNYVTYLLAGFTENDTFRSNQIREGEITREEALEVVRRENQPRQPNLKWYLDTLGLDYKEVVKVINSFNRLY